MNTHEFIMKRTGISYLLFFVPFLLLLYPFIIQEFIHMSLLIVNIVILGVFFLSYPLLQFTVKVKKDTLTINNVANVPYKEIQKAYVGTFSFVESFEEKDNLRLASFKDKGLSWFFKGEKGKSKYSGTFLTLNTTSNLFFIKADYFNEESFSSLIEVLNNKGIQVMMEDSPILMKKAV